MAGIGDWRAELRERSVTGRAVLLHHRWAVGLMDSRRSPGPENLRHHDAVLGCLAAQGFSLVRLYTNRLFAANIALYLRAGYTIDREEAFLGGVRVHMSKCVLPASPGPPTAPPAPA